VPFRTREYLGYDVPPLLLLHALIHLSAWNKNSRKFAVASNPSGAAPSTRQEHVGTPSASKRSDLVAVVAPLCIKGLRLVTVQLPKKSWCFGPGLYGAAAFPLPCLAGEPVQGGGKGWSAR
jgi:hypothetical protein